MSSDASGINGDHQDATAVPVGSNPAKPQARPLDGLIDFLWGEVSPGAALIGTLLKSLASFGIAWCLYEVLMVPALFSHPSEQTAALAQKFAAVAPIATTSGTGDTISICLDIVPKLSPQQCSDTEFASDVRYAAGYQIRSSGADGGLLASGSFYEVTPLLGLLSVTHVKESTDSMLRQLERFAYNSRDTAVSQLTLCAGTRRPLNEGCRKTADIAVAVDSKDGGVEKIVEGVRIGSLLTGPFQFVTLLLFVYALLEIVGLWLRWVAPPDRLFSVESSSGGARLVPTTPFDDALRNLKEVRVRSPGDRLFTRTLVAALHSRQPAPEVVRAEPPTEVAVDYGADILTTLESYRVYLLDDSVSRQEFLETLGDTLLKIAFLGTVYGISAALFSARALDTADPVLRLAVKSRMYSDIGIGFGTTLVGIILSIVVSQFRSSLAASWAEEIHRAYRLILDFGAKNMLDLTPGIISEDVPSPTPLRPKRQRWNILQTFGTVVLVVLVIVGFTAAWLFRDALFGILLLNHVSR
ncbi:hypothetical protein [Rhizobium ruizarguesonis]|jgi:hypothetical protein|uniref:hypothetical protein n=1 Tax=Rhizobium ruizarguesonis TaxID=2081791 RepID=UPI0013B9D3F4|nr:hypothetical protein [Rhizobium ruizarguesonis]NEH61401.1 hypothetical protein [Rhizobium ruizarguesonis]